MRGQRGFTGTPFKPFKRPARNYYRRRGGLPCDGCNKTCDWSDYYMVHDRVWVEEAGLPRDSCMLCIACLQTRLGRKLRVSDFPKNVPVNRIPLSVHFNFSVFVESLPTLRARLLGAT